MCEAGAYCVHCKWWKEPCDKLPCHACFDGDEFTPADADEIERLRDIITLSYMELAQYANTLQGARENSRRAEGVLDMGTNHWKLPDDLEPLRTKLGVSGASGERDNG
jgi:hypothetical protein